MDYEQAMAYIKNYKSAGISLGLERMRELCSRLDYPQQKLSFIHMRERTAKALLPLILAVFSASTDI